LHYFDFRSVEIGLVYGTVEDSYRKSSALINRVRHQEEATPFRTLRENTEYEGRQIMAHMEQQAVEILEKHGFTMEGVPTQTAVDRSQQVLVTFPPAQVAQAVQACAPEPAWAADMANNPVAYEDPTQSTQFRWMMSIDYSRRLPLLCTLYNSSG
jgi:hypothetical protein